MSEPGSLADLDVRHVDLDSANVEAHSQDIEVSVHQGPVEATSIVVETGQAPTMDNLVPAPQYSMLLTTSGFYIECAAPCTQYKCSSALARSGAYLPARNSSTNQHAPPRAYCVFRCARSAMQSARAPQGAAIQPIAGALWPSQATPYASVFMAPPS